jgi:UDP-glucose 4-epimerase
MTCYLVTGGAGFIGSHLVEALVKTGNTVRVVDNLTTGAAANLAAVRDRIELVVGDLRELNLVRRAVSGTEIIFHLASDVAAAARPPTAPATDTLHVLIAAREAGVRRVLYASCASVYGAAAHVSESGQGPLPTPETAPTNPTSPSAVDKLVGEQHCVAFTNLYGLDTVRLRYFPVFGPRQSPAPPGADVIRVLEAMLAGENPLLPHGDDETGWDMIYVEDVIYANLLAADLPRGAGKVFNIGRGRLTTLLDVVAMTNAILGTAIEPVPGPPADPGFAPRLADVALAETYLGHCASTDLEHALRRCIAYFDERDQARHDAFLPYPRAERAAAP